MLLRPWVSPLQQRCWVFAFWNACFIYLSVKIGMQHSTQESISGYIYLICFSKHLNLSLGTRKPIWGMSLPGMYIAEIRGEVEMSEAKLLISLYNSTVKASNFNSPMAQRSSSALHLGNCYVGIKKGTGKVRLQFLTSWYLDQITFLSK